MRGGGLGSGKVGEEWGGVLGGAVDAGEAHEAEAEGGDGGAGEAEAAGGDGGWHLGLAVAVGWWVVLGELRETGTMVTKG